MTSVFAFYSPLCQHGDHLDVSIALKTTVPRSHLMI